MSKKINKKKFTKKKKTFLKKKKGRRQSNHSLPRSNHLQRRMFPRPSTQPVPPQKTKTEFFRVSATIPLLRNFSEFHGTKFFLPPFRFVLRVCQLFVCHSCQQVGCFSCAGWTEQDWGFGGVGGSVALLHVT